MIIYDLFKPNWLETNTLPNEKWKDVPSYEGYYKISNFGRVKSVERILFNGSIFHTKKESILKPYKNSNGYMVTRLSKNNVQKQVQIHRLVAELFCNKKYTYYNTVNHRDSCTYNNVYTNLEWCTNAINNDHSLNRVRRQRKRYKSGKFFTPEVIKKIKFWHKHKRKSVEEMSLEFNTSVNSIRYYIYKK